MDGTGAYKWMKLTNGIGCVAIVELDVIPASSNAIHEQYSGKGFTSQGYVEEVPPHGYDSWKIAARNGLEYGFSLVPTQWKVYINKIEGRMGTDTNPTTVGYTVLRAFLDKAGFVLTETQIIRLESFVMSSWLKPYRELLPDFFKLTFKEYIL